MTIWILWLIAAYLLGSVSFALMLGRLKGIDIRSQGSGNLGATNAGRVLGKKWGIGCCLLDLGKGLVPVLGYALSVNLAGHPPTSSAWAGALLWLMIGLAAVLGHVFPIWLKFKGGKGAATSFGALLGFWPVLTAPALASAVIWYAVTRKTAYVGLASVVAALSIPVMTIASGLIQQRPPGEIAVYGGFTALLAALVVARHRSNLARLRTGTEAKVDWAQRDKRPAKEA